jgi:hypothetical protein
MSRRARRRLIVVIIVLVVAAVTAYVFGIIGGLSRDPVQLLATRPALPPTFVDAALGPGPIRIEWREEKAVGTTKPACGLGRGAIRSWSDGGDPRNLPDAFEKICVYRTPLIAWAVYRWQSLRRVAGEDWPNFEPGSDASTVPRNASTLASLGADEWEIGCGIGNPDALCGVWTFRARYDEVIVVTEVRTIDPGIGFGSVRRFVASLDRTIAARMRSR